MYFLCAFLLCSLLISPLSAHPIPSTEDDNNDNEDYLTSTCKNYDGRAQSFTEWAEEEDNAKSAAKCRKLLEEELGKSLDESGDPSVKEVHFLDAGCGSGRDLAGFFDEEVSFHNGKSKVPIKAEGFDCSKGLIEKAKQRGLNATVADFKGYLSKLPAGKKFDAVFSLAALFHLPEKQMGEVLAGFNAHMNPRGVILTTVPEGDMGDIMGDGRWITALSENKQKRMLEDAGFDVVHQGKTNIYNGNQWIVLVGKKRS